MGLDYTEVVKDLLGRIAPHIENFCRYVTEDDWNLSPSQITVQSTDFYIAQAIFLVSFYLIVGFTLTYKAGEYKLIKRLKRRIRRYVRKAVRAAIQWYLSRR